MEKTILVIGATGQIGRNVMEQLGRRGVVAIGATRDVEAAQRRVPGTRYVEFDFERPETFGRALRGVDRVFLIARPGDEHPERVANPLIDEMARQGVEHVVNLTAMGVESRNDISLRRVERHLEQSGVTFTHLRPNFFMQVFTSGPLMAGVRAGVIALPAGDARVSYVDAGDVASVAAAALTQAGHEGRAYTLTGPQAIDHDEVAAIVGRAIGKTVRYRPLSERECAEALEKSGLSPERIKRLLGFFRLVREGYCGLVSPDVERVLNRKPRSLARFSLEEASVWRG